MRAIPRLGFRTDVSLPIRLAMLAAGICVGLASFALQPLQALSVLLMTLALALILFEPRLGLIALPISVPWGSEIPIPLGSTTLTVSDLIVAAVVVSWLVQAACVRRFPIRLNPWLLATGMLLLVMVVSTTQSVSLTLSLREIVKWSEVLAIALVAPSFLRSRRDVWFVVAAIIVGGLSEACTGLTQFWLHIGPHNFQIYGHFVRAYGTFQQPNPFAGYLNICIALTAAAAWYTRKVSLWLTTVVIGLASVVTFSRAGWGAGLLGLLMVVALYAPRSRALLSVVGLAGTAGVAAATFSLIPLSPLTRVASSLGLTAINFHHHTKSNFSEVERAAHWVAGLRMFESHPLLGVGIGNYPIAYPSYHVGAFLNPLGHAHDYFINIAAEAGIMGLIAYGLFIMAGAWMAVKAARGPNDGLARMIGIGAVGMWVSTTFHNLFDVLYVHEIQLLISLVMALVAVSISPDLQSPTRYHTGDRYQARRATARPTRGLEHGESQL